MADQTVSLLQLVKRKDADSTDVNAVDFLSLPTELQYQGWNQGLPQPGQPGVDESITLLMNSGNANTLATALQAIDTKIKEIGWAQDPLNPIGVWLRAQLTGETNQRQCFILAAKRPPKGLEITTPLAYSGVIQNYNLGLTRSARWENVLKTQVPASPASISIHGGTLAYTIPGDAHARVAELRLTSNSQLFTEAWIGVKSNRYGVNPTNFVPVWNLDLGFLPTGYDTSTSADATAIDGTKLVCTFATHTEMSYRVIVALNTITANLTDQRGRYTVLLRAKTTDASLIVNLRVGQGYLLTATPTSFAFKPQLQISTANTGWSYYTLGQVTIPSSAGFSDLALSYSSLALQAQKISGSGNLELDSLILVPSEHTIHTASSLAGYGFGPGVDLYLYTRPDLRYAGLTNAPGAGNTQQIVTPDAIDWAIPSGSGVLIFVASRPATTLSDTTMPILKVYPAYNSLRGAS